MQNGNQTRFLFEQVDQTSKERYGQDRDRRPSVRQILSAIQTLSGLFDRKRRPGGSYHCNRFGRLWEQSVAESG